MTSANPNPRPGHDPVEQDPQTRNTRADARDIEQEAVLNDPQNTATHPDELNDEESARKARADIQRGFNG